MQDLGWLRSLIDNGLHKYLNIMKDLVKGLALGMLQLFAMHIDPFAVSREVHQICYDVICTKCWFANSGT